ncbi:MAG TPA: glycosyltransferase [Burkholderiales bacterium]|nr:glycosyltransferase [Burkholderiales bacterium]
MSRKSVLISYFFGDDMIPLGESCADAFRELGFEVGRFNSQVESRWQPALLKPVNRLARGLGHRGREIGHALPFSRVNFKRRMLMQAAAASRPRWIFVIRAHEFVDAELVDALKRECGVEKVIGWRVDGPLDTPDLLEDARIYDVYFCAHRHGYDPRADRIHPLPVYGMDFARYRNLFAGGSRPYNHEIVLVGGHNARREQLLGRLTDLPLEIYGKWGKRARYGSPLRRQLRARGIWGEALLRLYNTSKIVLNITNWDPARYRALNQRVFDVPATGAFLLTDYSPELEEHYRLGDELVTYRDVDELHDKACYYLAHDDERSTIARRGYERALTLPTIRDRMAQVVRVVEAS